MTTMQRQVSASGALRHRAGLRLTWLEDLTTTKAEGSLMDRVIQ
jgi:hypothetical protein